MKQVTKAKIIPAPHLLKGRAPNDLSMSSRKRSALELAARLETSPSLPLSTTKSSEPNPEENLSLSMKSSDIGIATESQQSTLTTSAPVAPKPLAPQLHHSADRPNLSYSSEGANAAIMTRPREMYAGKSSGNDDVSVATEEPENFEMETEMREIRFEPTTEWYKL